MTEAARHAELMDRTYRYQRYIYDVTRRCYLPGRDRLVRELAPPPAGRVLEIACGTGRNLALIGRAYPDCTLYGLDISREMLRTARSRLGGRAVLAQADACDYDSGVLFGADGFDRVVLSYSLSMIPDWRAALHLAARQLRPGGSLHVVDFGDQTGLPRWFRRGLHAWLARFHVTPRVDLLTQMQALAAAPGLSLRVETIYRDYARYGVLARRSAT